MKVYQLSKIENAPHQFTHKLVIPYTDITSKTSGTAFQIFPETGNFPIGRRISALAINVSTAFAHASTVVAEIGDGGDTARFLAASTDLKTAGFVENAQSKKPYIYAAADTIDLKVTVGAGALSTLSAGELEIYIAATDMQNLRK